MRLNKWIAAGSLILAISASYARAEDVAPPIEQFLTEGRLTDGAAAMQTLIDADSSDQQARFSLGVVQFLQAVEGLGQDQFRYGLMGNRARSLPFMRLPIAENSSPEKISYEKARGIIQKFVNGLTKAEQTLSSVKPDGIKLPLKLGLVRLDLDADGKLSDEETMSYISQVLQNPRNPGTPTTIEFPVTFDDGDVLWLQGYCHVFSALGEMVLAHDWQDQFERTAHLFYPVVDSPYEFLAAEGPGMFMSFGAQNIFDFVAWVHTINYEVSEPERMQKALMHMETVIRLSRKSWAMYEAETDDDHEWVPNPNQKSVIKGFAVNREIIDGWRDVLDEVEAILQGKKLAPFWRGIKGGVSPFGRMPQNPKIGINVRKIFTQPTRFDLALWLQGTGLTPYLEEGEISSPEKWQKMMTGFRGNFFNIALWFN